MEQRRWWKDGSKKGILYGVGVCPGDPELLTLKAVHLLQRCPVIAAPQTKSGETLALDIVRQVLPLDGKTILPLYFSMERDKVLIHAAHEKAAGSIQAHLDAGEDVAMLNLGDVSIYATWGYVMEVVRARGYETAMIPGIPSFCAAAARLDTTLVSWGSPLHVIPVGRATLEPQLELPGGKVLMKAGHNFPQIVEALKQTGQLNRAALVEDCGLPDERVCTDLGKCPEDIGYFATVIVKEK